MNNNRPALWRHFLAMIYDTCLIMPLFMASSFILVALFGVTEDISQPTVPVWFTRATWPLVLIVFFGLFWRKSGQTLGMQAWRIRLISLNGKAVSWPQVGIRCLAAMLSVALLGLGYLWTYIDSEGYYWHDRLSGTTLRLLPKAAKQ